MRLDTVKLQKFDDVKNENAGYSRLFSYNEQFH